MQFVTDNFTEPADHLSLDEAMLMAAEEGEIGPTLRLWHFSQPTVILGRSSKVALEVHQPYCDANRIGIYRRCSGGASVVGGPGCLMYSVVLRFDSHPHLQKIDVAHQFVMSRVLCALQPQVPELKLQGTCDLTLGDRKCSGNSLRMARHHLLYHGTVLHDFDLELISRCLALAPRQPEYRQGRDHDTFVTNIAIDMEATIEPFRYAFGVNSDTDTSLFFDRIQHLRQQRYDSSSWHFRH